MEDECHAFLDCWGNTSLIARRTCFLEQTWRLVPTLRAAYCNIPSLASLDRIFQHNILWPLVAEYVYELTYLACGTSENGL